MLDSVLRPLIDPPLNRAAQRLVRLGVTANALTTSGALLAIAALAALAGRHYDLALGLIAVNRLLDGLDGPLARIRGGSSDFGGYLDIVCDFVFYAAIPLGFGLAESRNLQPAAVLLASFLGAGTSFLAYAILAEKRGLTTQAQGPKSFFFQSGLCEGTETIAAFAAMCLWPDRFPQIAYGYAALCALTVLGRLASARGRFR